MTKHNVCDKKIEIMNILDFLAAPGGLTKHVRPGCMIINEPLKVLMIDPDTNEKIEVTADSVDVNGKYPETVHIKELGYWWRPELFEPTPEHAGPIETGK